VTTRAPEENKQEGPPAVNTNQGNNQKPAIKKEDKVVVFVNDNGTAKMVEVQTGISDYDNIEILSGLDDSTEVITGPFLVVSKRLKDGERIRSSEKQKDKDTKK
jgi:hypothetical protein